MKFALILTLMIGETLGFIKPNFFRNAYKGLNGSHHLKPENREKPVVVAAYYHGQTVAIVSLSPNNDLQDCDLVEVYEKKEIDEVLKNLSTITRPQTVSFREMITLMKQCDKLDQILREKFNATKPDEKRATFSAGVNSFSLFSGILPGTKWCGTGDIAENYHDLGSLPQIDRCCRVHDLCPIKVRTQTTRFSLTNNSIYSKSHCTCDGLLYQCLKSSRQPTANIMGHIYFNLLKIPCVEDIPENEQTLNGPTMRFVDVKKAY